MCRDIYLGFTLIFSASPIFPVKSVGALQRLDNRMAKINYMDVLF